MLKGILIFGIGFSLGYAKALGDTEDIKNLLKELKNDQELKDALKDLKEALKRAKEVRDEDKTEDADVIVVEPVDPTIPEGE